jgi:hypothetical protein
VTSLTRADLLDLESYERTRPAYREAIIGLKRLRRVAVGDRVSLVFESHETLRFQVQEMLRVEGIREPERVQHELDVYNGLLPSLGELSATLFIEITDPGRVRSELDRLVGIDEHVSLVLGEPHDTERIPARFDPDQMEEDRISAVQYVRFPLEPGQAEKLARADIRARICIDHPNYHADAELRDATRRELVRDLRGEAPSLLQPDPGASPPDEVLHETPELRVICAEPGASGHLVVELRREGCLLDLAPEALAPGLAEVQRRARELSRSHGSCSISVDAATSPVRWHLRGLRASPAADGLSPTKPEGAR